MQKKSPDLSLSMPTSLTDCRAMKFGKRTWLLVAPSTNTWLGSSCIYYSLVVTLAWLFSPKDICSDFTFSFSILVWGDRKKKPKNMSSTVRTMGPMGLRLYGLYGPEKGVVHLNLG